MDTDVPVQFAVNIKGFRGNFGRKSPDVQEVSSQIVRSKLFFATLQVKLLQTLLLK